MTGKEMHRRLLEGFLCEVLWDASIANVSIMIYNILQSYDIRPLFFGNDTVHRLDHVGLQLYAGRINSI